MNPASVLAIIGVVASVLALLSDDLAKRPFLRRNIVIILMCFTLYFGVLSLHPKSIVEQSPVKKTLGLSDPVKNAMERQSCREDCDRKIRRETSKCPQDQMFKGLSGIDIAQIDPYGNVISLEDQAIYGTKDRQCVDEVMELYSDCYNSCQ